MSVVVARNRAEGTTLIERFRHLGLEVVLMHDAVAVECEEVILRRADLCQDALRATTIGVLRVSIHCAAFRVFGGHRHAGFAGATSL
jgi:hypothetical protein